MPSVTVTSTVLNEVEDIDELVSTLAQQTMCPEVIIVDGGSTDGTWERLQAAQARYPNLRSIRDESCNLKACPGPIAGDATSASQRQRRMWSLAPMPAVSTIPNGWTG